MQENSNQAKNEFKKYAMLFFNKHCAPLQKRVFLNDIYIYLSNKKCIIGIKTNGNNLFVINKAKHLKGVMLDDTFVVNNQEKLETFVKLILDKNGQYEINPKLNNSIIINLIDKFCKSALTIEQVYESEFKNIVYENSLKINPYKTKSIYESCCLEDEIKNILQNNFKLDKSNELI